LSRLFWDIAGGGLARAKVITRSSGNEKWEALDSSRLFSLSIKMIDSPPYSLCISAQTLVANHF
jgi:hypothetical protein